MLKSQRFLEAGLIFIVSIVLFELLGLFIFKNFHNWEHRYLFISESNFRFLEDGLWTYQPNSSVRVAALYGFGVGSPWIESDCSWDTNEFGLIRTTESPARIIDLLILGDSFTEGQGGCPWLTQNTVSSIGATILNGGLQGNGIAQSRKLEQFLEKRVQINNVVIVAISEDFFRKSPHKTMEEEPCLKKLSCGIENWTWALSEKEWNNLLGLTEKRIEQRHSVWRRWQAFLKWHSVSARLVARVVELMEPLYRSPLSREPGEREALFQHNVSELRELTKKYPKMRLILIPQRDEVGLFGGKNANTVLVERHLQSDGINYEWCEISASDYMYMDGHPNSRGYRKMFDCLFRGNRVDHLDLPPLVTSEPTKLIPVLPGSEFDGCG